MASDFEDLDSGLNAGTIIRLVIFVAVFVYAVIFVATNSDTVHIDFVFFQVKARLWLGFVTSLVIGGLLGAFIVWFARRNKD